MIRSPRSSASEPSLISRLQAHAVQHLRRGTPCSALVLQPLAPNDQRAARVLDPEAAGIAGRCSPLGEVAERLRALLRHTDIVEVELGAAVGVLLPGADADGVRAVHLRLTHALERCPSGRAGRMEDVLRLAVGHASAIAADGIPIPAIAREMVCVAYVPRLTLSVSLPSGRIRHATVPDRHPTSRPALQRRPGRRAGRARLRLLPAEVGIGAAAEARESLRQHAGALRVPYVALPAHLPHTLRRLVNEPLARELGAVPIGRTRGVLTVAMRDPTDIAAMQRLAAATGLTIFPVLAAESELERALDQLPPEPVASAASTAPSI